MGVPRYSWYPQLRPPWLTLSEKMFDITHEIPWLGENLARICERFFRDINCILKMIHYFLNLHWVRNFFCRHIFKYTFSTFWKKQTKMARQLKSSSGGTVNYWRPWESGTHDSKSVPRPLLKRDLKFLDQSNIILSKRQPTRKAGFNNKKFSSLSKKPCRI